MASKNFVRDKDGVAAVEFGLILPILVALLLGSVAAFTAFKTYRATSHSANITVDLLSRQAVLDDATRDTLFAAARALVAGFSDDDQFGVTIASIVNTPGGLEVGWSEADGTGTVITDANLALIDLPVIPESESVVFIRITNGFTPAIGGSLNFTRESLRRPRFVASIAYDDGS